MLRELELQVEAGTSGNPEAAPEKLDDRRTPHVRTQETRRFENACRVLRSSDMRACCSTGRASQRKPPRVRSSHRIFDLDRTPLLAGGGVCPRASPEGKCLAFVRRVSVLTPSQFLGSVSTSVSRKWAALPPPVRGLRPDAGDARRPRRFASDTRQKTSWLFAWNERIRTDVLRWSRRAPSVDACPPEITSATWSKYPVPTSRW